MRRFVRSIADRLTDVAVLACMGGSGAANANAEVECLLGRPVVAQLALRQADIEAGRHDAALEAFGDEVDVRAGTRGRRTAIRLAPLRA